MKKYPNVKLYFIIFKFYKIDDVKQTVLKFII